MSGDSDKSAAKRFRKGEKREREKKKDEQPVKEIEKNKRTKSRREE